MKLLSSEINASNSWQIGTGDGTRSIHHIFLRYGVAIVGPGDPGKEGDSNTKLYYIVNPEIKNWGKALSQVQPGEWMIARNGRSEIVAVGKVLDGCNHSNLFSDVDGWDMQHFVKVKWFKPIKSSIKLGGNVLGMHTLQGCKKPAVFDAIYAAEFEEVQSEFEVEDIAIPKTVGFSELIDVLIDNGIRITDAENISTTIQRVSRLARWYQERDPKVLEHEVVAFLILPLLMALGWSEQKIKLEYKYIDVVLFDRPFTGDYEETPRLILEAKTFSNGLALTHEQINRYSKVFPNCKRFLVTNGFRYKYFERMGDSLTEIGYFNLLRLTERNVLEDVPLSSLDTILKISNFAH
jgi:hypothetical protein